MPKQLFASVSSNSVDVYLTTSRVDKYLPLFTDSEVNNFSKFGSIFSRIFEYLADMGVVENRGRIGIAVRVCLCVRK